MQLFDGGVESELLEGVGTKLDDLIPQRSQVAFGDLLSVIEQGHGRVGASFGSRLLCRCEDHVQSNQLLQGSVVDGLGHPPAHLGLGLDRAARQAASAQTARRLGAVQASHHEAGCQGAGGEGHLVERQDVAIDRGVPAHRRSGNERECGDHGGDQAARLPLKLGVSGDQEQGREAHAAVGLRGNELDREQRHEVTDSDQAVEPRVRVSKRHEKHEDRPGEGDPGHHGYRAAVLGKREHEHRHDAHDHDRQAADRKQDQRLGGLDPEAAQHQAAALARGRARSRRAMRPAPALSMAQSTALPWRPSTKD